VLGERGIHTEKQKKKKRFSQPAVVNVSGKRARPCRRERMLPDLFYIKASFQLNGEDQQPKGRSRRMEGGSLGSLASHLACEEGPHGRSQRGERHNKGQKKKRSVLGALLKKINEKKYCRAIRKTSAHGDLSQGRQQKKKKERGHPGELDSADQGETALGAQQGKGGGGRKEKSNRTGRRGSQIEATSARNKI